MEARISHVPGRRGRPPGSKSKPRILCTPPDHVRTRNDVQNNTSLEPTSGKSPQQKGGKSPKLSNKKPVEPKPKPSEPKVRNASEPKPRQRKAPEPKSRKAQQQISDENLEVAAIPSPSLKRKRGKKKACPSKELSEQPLPSGIDDTRQQDGGRDNSIAIVQPPAQSLISLVPNCLPEANASSPQILTANETVQQSSEPLLPCIKTLHSVRTKRPPCRLQPEVNSLRNCRGRKKRRGSAPELTLSHPRVRGKEEDDEEVFTAAEEYKDAQIGSTSRPNAHSRSARPHRPRTVRTPSPPPVQHHSSDVIVLSPGISIHSEYQSRHSDPQPLRFVNERSPEASPERIVSEPWPYPATTSTTPVHSFNLDNLYQYQDHPSPPQIYEQSPAAAEPYNMQSHWTDNPYLRPQPQYSGYSHPNQQPGFSHQQSSYLSQPCNTPIFPYSNTIYPQPVNYCAGDQQSGAVQQVSPVAMNVQGSPPLGTSQPDIQLQNPGSVASPVFMQQSPMKRTVDAETQTMPTSPARDVDVSCDTPDPANLSFLENEIRSIEMNMLGNGHTPIEDYMRLYNTVPPSELQLLNVFDNSLPPDATPRRGNSVAVELPRRCGKRRLTTKKNNRGAKRQPQLTVVRVAPHETIEQLTQSENVRVVYVSEKEFRDRSQFESLFESIPNFGKR